MNDVFRPREQTVSEREWDRLFELMEKATNLPGLSATEKGETIKSEAKARSAIGTLEEFLAECAD